MIVVGKQGWMYDASELLWEDWEVWMTQKEEEWRKCGLQRTAIYGRVCGRDKGVEGHVGHPIHVMGFWEWK